VGGEGGPGSLSRAAQLAEDLIGTLGAIVVAVDARGLVRHWNAGAEKIFGLSAAEVLGRPVPEHSADAQVPFRLRDYFALGLAGRATTRQILASSDGSPLTATLAPVRDESSTVLGAVATASIGPPGAHHIGHAAVAEAIFGQAPVGVGVVDRCCRFTRANEALQKIVGLPLPGILGRTLPDLLPGTVGERAGRRLAEVLRTGHPAIADELVGPLPTVSGEGAILASHYQLKAFDDSVVGGACILSDVTEQHTTRRALQYANERLALLGRASTVLSESLDLERTLAGLGALVVPAFADHCLVDLLEEGGRLRRVAVVHTPTLEPPEGVWSVPGSIVSYVPANPIHHILAGGQPLITHINPVGFDFDSVTCCTRSAVFAREVGVRSMITVPLRAAGHLMGVAAFLTSVSGRRYTPDDLRLAGQLADRAAVAIDNARMYAREQGHALTLQRSLLPERLPEAPGISAAARYMPATDGGEVGGDWYDLIALPAGRIAVVVGDVMGRGLQAAALMGQIRAALRAYAMQDLPAEEVLTHADELVRGLAATTLVTCVFGVYDPRDQMITMANAGQVPPLLAGDGVVDRLGATGPPLGAGWQESYGVHRAVFRPGQVLALYTDGLVESREQDLDVGIDHLAQALLPVTGHHDDLEHGCDHVLSALEGEVGFDDDVALFMLCPDPTTRPRVARLVIPPQPRDVAGARAFATERLTRWGLPGEIVTLAALVVSELVTNAIRHTRTTSTLLLSLHGGELTVEVRDRGYAMVRSRRTGPDDESGRGLLLVESLTSGWGVRTTEEGKAVWCALPLPGASRGVLGGVREFSPVRSPRLDDAEYAGQ
jgi:PAS domain S-box-containing protein